MENDIQKLIESLALRRDEDLIKMINEEFRHYRPEALEVARAEMTRRGFRINGAGHVKLSKKRSRKQNKSRPEVSDKSADRDPGAGATAPIPGSPTCPRCGISLDYSGTRRLNAEKDMSVLGELVEMYKSGAQEFLDVYICGQCGHAEFFVDGIGEQYRPQ